MTPILLIFVLLGSAVEVEKLDFRTIESCELARAELERELFHGAKVDAEPIVAFVCIDRSVSATPK